MKMNIITPTLRMILQAYTAGVVSACKANHDKQLMYNDLAKFMLDLGVELEESDISEIIRNTMNKINKA